MMRRFLFLLVAFSLCSCGYRPVGSGSCPLLAGERVAVRLFENRTAEPFIENRLTNALVAELAADTRVALDRPLPTVQLEGEVIGYYVNAVSYDRNDEIRSYRLSIEVDARLVRPAEGRRLWRQTLVGEAEYAAAADRTLQQDNERLAIRRAVAELAADLHTELCLAKGND